MICAARFCTHNVAHAQSRTVDIPAELKASLRKFRFARRNAGHAAMVVKINKQKLIMEEVEQFDDISIEDLAEGAFVPGPSAALPPPKIALDRACTDLLSAVGIELPENSPRYVVLSYELNHSDGRKSFPLVLVNWAPTSSEMGLLTLHASAFIDFQNTVRSRAMRYGVQR